MTNTIFRKLFPGSNQKLHVRIIKNTYPLTSHVKIIDKNQQSWNNVALLNGATLYNVAPLGPHRYKKTEYLCLSVWPL